MVDIYGSIFKINVFQRQSTKFRYSHSRMKEYLHHFIVFAVHHIAMHKLQELSHLVFCNCLSYDCIIYQYSGKLKSEWILYQNVIIHCHLKGWSQHSPDGMNGTVAFPIFLLQFYKKQLCIGCFHTSYRLFAKCFSMQFIVVPASLLQKSCCT